QLRLPPQLLKKPSVILKKLAVLLVLQFLFLIGEMNTIVFISVFKTLRCMKQTGTFEEADIEEIMNNGGVLGRFFRPVYQFIDSCWKMYPLGVSFGLRFDSSIEVGLLRIATV
ncbi:2744_t:CDS:1, partial [Ambispora leptoticha]